MTWWQQLLIAYLTAPFGLTALWITACELTRWRSR